MDNSKASDEVARRFSSIYLLTLVPVLIILIGVGSAIISLKSVAKRENSWMVKIVTSGGMNGRGEGNAVITSQGDLAIEYPLVGLTSELRCHTKLPTEDLRKIEWLVLTANPSSWRENYFDPRYVGDDYFEYKLELHYRQEDGTECLYTASWSDGSVNLLPKGLSDLHREIRTSQFKLIKACVPEKRY